MNFFHKIQNFGQISDLISQIWLKKRHTSLFSGVWREIRKKIHQNFAEKCKIRRRKWKKSEIQLFNREKMLTIFGWNFEIEERCKGVHCVDLGESFPTSIYLQKSASIQPRTSASKFGEKFNSLFTSLLNRLSDRRVSLRPLSFGLPSVDSAAFRTVYFLRTPGDCSEMRASLEMFIYSFIGSI